MDVTVDGSLSQAGWAPLMDQDIGSFLASFGLEDLASAFHEHEFDSVRDLHEAEIASSDLAELGVAALKKRKLMVKAVAAAAAASLAAAPSPKPRVALQPEPEHASPRTPADRNGTRKKTKSVCTAVRLQRLSQPKSPVPESAVPAKRQPTPTGVAAASAAAELLHGSEQERREQQKREMQERLEFQRNLKQISMLGRFPAEHGEAVLASAEQVDREREELAWAKQEEWEAKQARKRSRSKNPRAAAGGGRSSATSIRRLDELSKPIVSSSEVWRVQRQEETYAAVAKLSIHAPDKQQGVDVSGVVGRLYAPARSEPSVAVRSRDVPAWGSPAASQPRRTPLAVAGCAPQANGGRAKCQPSVAEREALSRLRRPTRSSLASDKSQGHRDDAKSRATQPHRKPRTDNPAAKLPMRVKGRTKLRTQAVASDVLVEEAEPPQNAHLESGWVPQRDPDSEAEHQPEQQAQAEVEPEPAPKPEPEPEPEQAASITLSVQVPSGVHAGDTIAIEMANGQQLDVEIPEGLGSGDEFDLEIDGLGDEGDLRFATN